MKMASIININRNGYNDSGEKIMAKIAKLNGNDLFVWQRRRNGGSSISAISGGGLLSA